MNNITFKKDLLGVQDDLLRFAYKLTSDREEANDLLQETSHPPKTTTRLEGFCLRTQHIKPVISIN